MDDSEHEADEIADNSASSLDDTAISPTADRYEGAVPPGYDWPTHGGYLGCLIGLMASCLIGGFAAKLVGLYTYYHHITGVPNVLLLLAVFAIAIVICTNLGWRLGRRFFREYAQKPTWGESDDIAPAATEDAPEERVEPSAN